MDVQSVTLGRRIAAARVARGWNKSELARRAGVAPSYITRVEMGKFQRPSVDQIKQIADALGLNVADLTDPPRAPLSPGLLGELEALFGEDDLPLLAQAVAALKRHSPRQRRKVMEILHSITVDLPETPS